ncbi:MAG: hypothetical protein WCY62_04200 [Clostridia bacterium]
MKKKLFKIIYMIFAILFVLSAITTTVLMLSFDKDYACPRFGNYILVSISDSYLSPKIFKGSALLSDLEFEQADIGDHAIITTKSNEGLQYAARIVEKVEDEYYTVSGTEGKGSFYVSKDSVIAVSRFQFYGLGAYMDVMRTQAGFFGFIIIPLIIIIMIQIIRMVSLIQEKHFKEQMALQKQSEEKTHNDEVDK